MSRFLGRFTYWNSSRRSVAVAASIHSVPRISVSRRPCTGSKASPTIPSRTSPTRMQWVFRKASERKDSASGAK